LPDELERLRAEVESLKAQLEQVQLKQVEGGQPPQNDREAGEMAAAEETNADLLSDVLRIQKVPASEILREALGFAILTISLSGEIQGWNAGAERLTGWSEAEILGQSALLFFTPEDREAGVPDTEMGTALREGRASDRRWHMRKDSSRFFANGEMTLLRDDAGSPAAFLKIMRDDTNAKLAEDRLRESENLLRAYLEAMPNQVWTAHPDGSFAWFNQRVYAESGATPEEMREGVWTRIMLPEDLAIARERWEHALATGTPFSAEFRLLDKERGHRWYLSRALPIRDTRGRIVQWIGTNTDIDDQKLIETQHARDRNRMWALSQDLMMVCDFEGKIITVNPSSERLLGWTEEEMVDRPISDFVHPDDLAISAAEVAKLSGGQPTLAFENRYRCKNGQYRLFDWTAVPEAGHIHGIGRDITLERAAARERDRTWELSPVLKLVIAADGTIITCNPSWTRVLGWTLEDVLGRAVTDFMPPEDRAGSEARRAILVSGETLPEYQATFLGKDDTRHRISWITVFEGGSIFAFGRDVTAELEAAEALHEAEEALRQSQKMEAIGQLTGGIAHDFNNLLAGIIGSMDLVRKRIEQGRLGELSKYLDAASTSANRAAALTARLLAFGRRQSLDARPSDINGLVAGLEDLLRRTIGESIALEIILKTGLWAAITDANQFESALLNMAINARDAMPNGGKLTIETNNTQLDALYVRGFEGLEAGDYVVVCVSDTGQGMDQAVLERAFDPFFTTKPLGQGTGLGLSMIYGFAKQVGGHVRIYSEIGHGTTIKLYMRRHAGNVEAEIEKLPPEQHLAGAGESVLVVEDDSSIRMLVMETLSDLGYQADSAPDAKVALPKLEAGGRIDLLITDVGLPGGMNGRQLADWARLRRPGLKVLFITGYAEGAAIRSGFLDPGMEMITKPFPLDVLTRKIREMIEG